MSVKLKKHLSDILKRDNFIEILKEIGDYQEEKTVNALISFFFHSNNIVRFNAIFLFGKVVAKISEKNLEKARVIMRRLMWSLNDESGGIGWGSPEAMAEIMANNRLLADEYFHILFSYIRPDGNFIEYEPLRQGVFWGLARLAPYYPDLFIKNNVQKHLEFYINSHNEVEKTISALCLGFLINYKKYKNGG